MYCELHVSWLLDLNLMHRNNMAHFVTTLALLVLLPFILGLEAVPEIGFSARLQTSSTILRSSWTPIRGWENKGYSLIFEYGVKLDSQKQNANLPFSGIYFISANILVKSRSKLKMKICIKKDLCQESDQNEDTYTVVTQDVFEMDDILSVSVLATEDLTVLEGSTFAVQYLGPASRMPGFLAFMSQSHTVQLNTKFNIIGGWKLKDVYSVQQVSSKGLPDSSILKVACAGMYLVTVTLSFHAKNAVYEVQLMANQNEIKYRKLSRYNGVATVTLLKNLKLKKSNKLAVQVRCKDCKDFQILKSSRFAAVYIGNNEGNFAEFLQPIQERTYKAGIGKHTLENYLPENVIKSNNIKKVQTEQGLQSYLIALPKHGVYVITIHLNLKISSRDRVMVKTLVFNAGLVAATSINGNQIDANCNGQPNHYTETSLLSTGVLALQAHDLIEISLSSACKDSFEILTDSWISFMAIRSQDIAAGFLVSGAPLMHGVTGTSGGLILNATFLNVMPLGASLTTDQTEFRCSLRGIYLISLNLVLAGKKSGFETINVQLMKERRAANLGNEIDTSSITVFNANISIYERLSALTATFLHNFEESDYISLRVFSESKVEIQEGSSFFISLVDFVESGRTFLAELNKQAEFIRFDDRGIYKIQSWIPITQGSSEFVRGENFIVPDDGYYLISCYVEIFSSSNVTIKNKLSLLLFFDENNMDFGLRDETEVFMKGNGSMSILLNANGVLKAKKGSRLRSSIHASRLGINATILSGKLSMTFYSDSEDAPSAFRNLQSSTKLLSLKGDNWEYLNERIDENANGKFKTNDVAFLGLHFQAMKSMLAFVSASTVLHGVDGSLEYGVVLHTDAPKKLEGLTITADVNSESPTTLKWSGLVYLEPWQQLSLAVRRKDDKTNQFSSARTSWTSLSLLALSFPKNTKILENDTRFQKAISSAGQWFLSIKPKSAHSKDKLPTGEKTFKVLTSKTSRNLTTNHFQGMLLPRFKLYETEGMTRKVTMTGKSVYPIDKVFSKISKLRSYFDKSVTTSCVVGLFSVRLRLWSSTTSHINLVYQTASGNMTLSSIETAVSDSANILQFNGIMCLDSLRSILIKGLLPFNATIANDTELSYGLIDSFDSVEGFSSLQKIDQVLLLDSTKKTRIDGWVSYHDLGFDSSLGFKQPYGSYVVQTAGKYFTTANLILRAVARSEITVGFCQSDQYVDAAVFYQSMEANVTTTMNLAALVNADKWQLLELKIEAKTPVSLSVLAGSTFSVILIDQSMATDSCEQSLLQMKAVEYRDTASRIGADVTLPCSTTDSRFVDFYWLRDEKVAHFIPSSQDGTLVIKSASENDTASYQCKINSGDFAVFSHKIKVIVYDPRPRVFVKNLTVLVMENSTPHQALTSIDVKAATPRDSENALVSLFIEPTDMARIFYISPHRTRRKATIKSRMAFDYEARKQYNFTLIAFNVEFGGIAKSTISFQIKVVDQNDNPPQFARRSYEVNVPENAPVGKVVFSVKANDTDTGVNAQIRYSLHYSADSDSFEIEKDSGEIRLKKSLKTQRRRSFVLFVIASNDPFSAFVEIVVRVVDLNDNRPYFNPTMYQINVTETTEIGSIVSRVFAYDADVDPSNRNITYRIVNAGDTLPFDIDSKGNIRIIHRLERLAGELLTVKVVAYDGHRLRSTNEATIVFRVVKTIFVSTFSTGLRFTTDIFRAKVREDAPIGTLVATVKAFYPENSHYRLRYVFIMPENSYDFSISEKSGEILTNSPLDYENQTRYLLSVFACDVDGNSECTAAKVEIDVENINDNFPEFSHVFYEKEIEADINAGSEILQVKAVDKDLGVFGVVRYTIDSRGSDLPFSIGEYDGIIRMIGNLQYLKADKCVFAVSASNSKEGKDKRQALVKFSIKSTKKASELVQLPAFEKDFYEFSVPENISVGQKIANPKLVSLVSPASKYLLVDNNNFTFKTIPDKGGIYLAHPLDFELQRIYELFLIVELNNDMTLRSYTRIRVNVTDVNDNRPQFARQNYETFIRGSLKPGRFVTKIKAFDQDSGVNSQINYNFDTNSTIKEFTLDRETGDLKVKKISKTKKYHLPLIACDSGTPQLCERNRITVHISNNTHEGDLPSSLLDSNFTFVEVEFDAEQYISDERDQLDVRFIAQEVHIEHPYYSQYSQLPPVTWYHVYYKTSEVENHLRRFIASEKTFTFQRKQRVRRDVSTQKRRRLLRFKYGVEDYCGEVWKADKICNGPLQPGTDYRFQLEIRYMGSNSFIKTGFTKSYRTGPRAAKQSPVIVEVTEYKFPYWIALTAVSGVLLLLLIILVICCCCCRKKTVPRYDIAIQKNNSLEDCYLPWNTETESQELTVWFSEESICNGRLPHGNTDANTTRL